MRESVEIGAELGLAAVRLSERQDAITEAWREAMAGSDHGPSSDHLPEMLQRIAYAIRTGDTSVQPLQGSANRHGIARLRAGYGLREVVAEFRALRRVLAEELTNHDVSYSRAIALMHDIIDRAVANAVDEYVQERDRTRDRFISILSHDLAQPLNAIRFGAQALADTAAAESPEYTMAFRVCASAARMQSMVSDLLEFARGRAGQTMPIALGRVDFPSLICRVAEEIGLAHPSRSIQCLVSDPADGREVEWDAHRVTQALSNVLTNAVTHGEDPIVIDSIRHGNVVMVEVRNRGEIPADALPRLFEPFTGGQHRNGLGLGLYIVDRVVKAHGGTVRAQSSEGVTTVQLALPCRPRRAAAHW